jgi:hypothetical protein
MYYYSSYNSGGGGGASFVRGYIDGTRDSTGVIVGAGGGGGGVAGSTCHGGGGGGGTWDGAIGRHSGASGIDGNGGRGSNYNANSGGVSDHGGHGGDSATDPAYSGADANGAGGERIYGSYGGGGGGAASFKNAIPGTERTVDASDSSPINTDDPYYSSDGSGMGRNNGGRGIRGRVVLLVGGEATAFDTTYTSHSSSYSDSIIDSNSHDFLVRH